MTYFSFPVKLAFLDAIQRAQRRLSHPWPPVVPQGFDVLSGLRVEPFITPCQNDAGMLADTAVLIGKVRGSVFEAGTGMV